MAWAPQEYGSYSKVKREETYSSEADTLDATSEDGAKTEKGSYAGRLIYFLLSLNAGLLLVLIIMFAVHWQPHSKKGLLPSPVPECQSITSLSTKRAPLIFLWQFLEKFEHLSWTHCFSPSQQKKATLLGKVFQDVSRGGGVVSNWLTEIRSKWTRLHQHRPKIRSRPS